MAEVTIKMWVLLSHYGHEGGCKVLGVFDNEAAANCCLDACQAAGTIMQVAVVPMPLNVIYPREVKS